MKHLFFLFLFAINNLLFAHSGNTDSKGGHYNHETGEYHYHNSSSGVLPFFICIFLIIFILPYLLKSKSSSPIKKNTHITNKQKIMWNL